MLMGVTILKDPKLAERLQFIQFGAWSHPPGAGTHVQRRPWVLLGLVLTS